MLFKLMLIVGVLAVMAFAWSLVKLEEYQTHKKK